MEAECEGLCKIEDVASERDVLLKEGQRLQNILQTQLEAAKAEVLAEKVRYLCINFVVFAFAQFYIFGIFKFASS